MKKLFKSFRLTILTLIVAVLVSQTQIIQNIFSPKTAYAVGDLTVSWEGAGTGDTGPMFTTSNMAPGQSSQKTITVQNGASSSRPIGIKGIKTNETGSLGDEMEITITRNGTDVYGGTIGTKTLTQFITDSNGGNGIPLGTINPGQTSDYVITVSFNHDAGNTFQNKTITFNLSIGLAIDIPLACQGITFTKTIYGTQGNDTINGTNGNDLIYGLEGNDKIDGGNGNDCVVGGAGNNNLVGGNGNDVLVGDSGNDKIDGGNGNDMLFGNGGNDVLSGGNDKDQAFGGPGNDTLRGENGNDQLVGDTGNDTAIGGNGTDKCTAESKSTCEL